MASAGWARCDSVVFERARHGAGLHPDGLTQAIMFMNFANAGRRPRTLYGLDRSLIQTSNKVFCEAEGEGHDAQRRLHGAAGHKYLRTTDIQIR